MGVRPKVFSFKTVKILCAVVIVFGILLIILYNRNLSVPFKGVANLTFHNGKINQNIRVGTLNVLEISLSSRSPSYFSWTPSSVSLRGQGELVVGPDDYLTIGDSNTAIYATSVSQRNTRAEEIKDTLESRLQAVKMECQAYSFQRPAQRKNWIVASFTNQVENNTKQVNLRWCPVFKAASTPWLAMFLKMKNHFQPRIEQAVRDGRSDFFRFAKFFKMTFTGFGLSDDLPDLSELNNANQSYVTISVLIVRHPFQRLLSAYRDKLERVKGREYYHAKFGRHIVQYFRRPSLRTRHKDRNSTSPWWDDTPSFPEFVKYLLIQPPAEMNEHWRPVYIDCNACVHDFNLILKVETMDRDKEYLLGLLGLDQAHHSRKALNHVWKTWTNQAAGGGSSHSSRSAQYFSLVPQNDILKLYKIYEPDFQMFGYKIDSYLRLKSRVE